MIQFYFEYDNEGNCLGFLNTEVFNEIPSNCIEINKELWEELLKGNYKVNLEVLSTIQNKTLTLEDKDNVFVKIELEVIEIPEDNVALKVLAKQLGLLTLENKKKDVQIESLMKAVSTLMNK